MKIVVLDGYTLNPGDLSWDGFKALGDVVVYDRTSADQTAERIGDADIVITNKTVIDQHVLDACPAVKYIGVLATGYNVVDIVAAKNRGIPVTNVPAYGTRAVSQFAIALLLEICHHIGEHSQTVRAGDWTRNLDFCYWNHPLIELAGKTIGIVGFGRIGQQTATIAQALGMKVLAHANHRKAELESETLQYADLDELFTKADIISLHCPLFESTKGIINKDSIDKMKDGVIIINTSRGPLIVEEDLADALNSGKVYAAAVDVVSAEPISAENPLLKAKNCIITPHIAWAPQESRARLLNIAVDNFKSFLAHAPVNVVNQ
ncbi:MAG: D-2-hydroxyacid dehydrogenase [Sporomusaceae bacterium]|nr:D-2-hydroxyacid dehydrogenase [Sporomusaceae bacterium]